MKLFQGLPEFKHEINWESKLVWYLLGNYDYLCKSSLALYEKRTDLTLEFHWSFAILNPIGVNASAGEWIRMENISLSDKKVKDDDKNEQVNGIKEVVVS